MCTFSSPSLCYLHKICFKIENTGKLQSNYFSKGILAFMDSKTVINYIFTDYPLLRSGEVNNSRIYVSFQLCARENVCARACSHRLLPQFVVSVDHLVIIKKRILMGTRKKMRIEDTEK